MNLRSSALWLAFASATAWLSCAPGAPARSQDIAWTFQPPRANFVAASYAGRDFLDPWNHLGEDSAHLHHDPVHAIAAGIVRYANYASGYGRVVAIEHLLPDGRRVTSIYGHLCSHAGYPLVEDGASVQAGDRVGFVGDDAENGDGREHIHLGIRTGAYDGYFCGYAREPECPPSRYHRPSEFIAERSGRMRLISGLDLNKAAPKPKGPATFTSEVRNDWHDGGAFEFRLRLRRGDAPPTYSAVQVKRLKPGESDRVEFLEILGEAGSYEAALEIRPPGVEAWSEVAPQAPALNPRTFAVGQSADNCAAPKALPARGGIVQGRTAGGTERSGSCGGATAPEAVYRWTPKISGKWKIDTCGSAFDTVLYVRTGSCETALDAACNDDSKPCKRGGSQLLLDATAGVTYYIVVDGRPGAAGAYRLAVARK